MWCQYRTSQPHNTSVNADVGITGTTHRRYCLHSVKTCEQHAILCLAGSLLGYTVGSRLKCKCKCRCILEGRKPYPKLAGCRCRGWAKTVNYEAGTARCISETHCKLGSRMVKSWNARDLRSCEEVSKSCETILHSVSSCPGPATPLALTFKEGCCSAASLIASVSCSIPEMVHLFGQDSWSMLSYTRGN